MQTWCFNHLNSILTRGALKLSNHHTSIWNSEFKKSTLAISDRSYISTIYLFWKMHPTRQLVALSKRDTYIRSNYFSSQTLNIPILLIIDQSLQKFSLGYILSASLRVSPSSWPLKCSGRQKLAAQIKRQIVAQLPVWKKDSGTLNVYWLFETHLCITQSNNTVSRHFHAFL